MVWEAIFMLLVLKIPVLYLSIVVWTAIRAEPPLPDGPVEAVPVGGHMPPQPSRPSRLRAHHRRPGPGGVSRRPSRTRPAAVRAEAQR